jgi:tetratricopeptide (TPR) repeat protein
MLRHQECPDGQPRFTMLEALREFALERLAERKATEETRQRHASYYLKLSEQIEPDLGGPQQAVLLQVLEREHDNMRGALHWALERGDAELGMRLCVALWWFWFVRGYLSEGRRWLEAVLAKGVVNGMSYEQSLLRAKVLNAAGVLAHDQGDYTQATTLHEQSLTLVRALGRTGGIAASLNNLGLVARSQGEYERAAKYYAESLELRREQGDEWSMAVALSNLGLVACDQGQYERAVAFYEESLALRQKLGDKRGIAIILNQLGVAEYHQRDYARAATLHEESLALQSELTDKAGAADSFYGLAKVASVQGDHARAYRFYAECLALRRELGDRAGIATCLEGIATVAEASGRSQQAARLLGAAQALRDAIGASLSPIDMSSCQQITTTVRASLGEAAFASAWVEGQTMSPEQAVTYTLDRGDSWF